MIAICIVTTGYQIFMPGQEIVGFLDYVLDREKEKRISKEEVLFKRSRRSVMSAAGVNLES